MKKVAPPPPAVPLSKPVPPSLTNGDLKKAQQQALELHQLAPMSSIPGEDCAFNELLEGRMDLEVVLPDKRVVSMTVDRRTPMMDLLVHAATANNISPGGHIIKVVSKEDHNVLYKPNTPIGSLDVNTMYIVPKATVDIPVKRMPKLANQPFEQQTFRLQVNLPRNQRMVLRVSPRISLAELKRQICSEKELDHSNHHLVHPAQPDTVLDLNSTLDIYGCAEISLMSNSGLRDSIRSTSTHLIGYTRIEEEKKKKGILRLFSKKKKDGPVETNTNGLGSRGVSPTRCQDNSNRECYQSKQSIKRKPAPAPPPPVHPPSPTLVIQSSSSINSRPESEISAKTDELGSTVSHSRHSSDSSGYHEPSVFSDCSENKSPEASIVHGGNVLSGNDSAKDLPGKQTTSVREASNLKVVPSCSNTSIVSASRKRKAPQPPAPVLPEVETPSSPEQSPDDQSNPITLAMNKAVPLTLPSPDCEVHDRAESDDRLDSRTIQQDQEQDAGVFEILEDEEELESVASDEVADYVGELDEATSQQEVEAITCLDNVLENEMPSFGNLIPVSNKLPDDDEQQHHDVVDSRDAEDEVVESEQSRDLELSMPCSSPTQPSEFQPSASLSCCPPSDAPDLPPVPSNEDILSETTIRSQSVNSEQEHFSDVDSHQRSSHDVQDDCEVQSKESVANELEIQKTDTTELELSYSSGRSSCEDRQTEEHIPSNEVPLNSIQDEVSSKDSANPVASPISQKRLVSFAMGCYKKEEPDIYSEQPNSSNTQVPNSSKSSEKVKETMHSKPERAPDVKIVPFNQRVVREQELSTSNTNQQQSTKGLPEMEVLPASGRSVSMYNLGPKEVPSEPKPPVLPEESKSNPCLNGIKRTHSDQNLSQEALEEQDKSDFIQEQKRLHEEYLKLQAQFISWQKQLLNNQSLLQSEQILPQISLGALEQFQTQLGNLPAMLAMPKDLEGPVVEATPNAKSLPNNISPSVKETPSVRQPIRSSKSREIVVHAEINKVVPREKSATTVDTQETYEKIYSSNDANNTTAESQANSKCQTLPRHNSRPPVSAFETTRTMTLNRQPRQKSQVVSVTIGSWQQRNEADASNIDSASVASSRSMFQSLENIPRNRSEAPAQQAPPVQKRQKSPSVISSSEKTNSVAKCSEITATVSVKEPSVSTSDDLILPMEDTAEGTRDQQQRKATRCAQPINQKPKVEIKQSAEASVRARSSKPIVRLSSMKDDSGHPPPLHVLTKWPLPGIKEKQAPAVKTVERSLWEEVKASAKRSTGGGTQEKVKRAEVDLRKHRSSSKSSEEAIKNAKESEPSTSSASKIHVTKINIYSADKTVDNKVPRSQSNSDVTKKVSKTLITPQKEIPENGLRPFDAELKSVLSKRSNSVDESKLASSSVEPTYSEAVNGQNGHTNAKSVSVNGTSPPPPPPPPVSTMPAIPPAAPIPKSSQLLMGKNRNKGSTKSRSSQSKTKSSNDPREELMLEIRGFGGRQALRKLPKSQPGWHLKVYGSASTATS